MDLVLAFKEPFVSLDFSDIYMQPTSNLTTPLPNKEPKRFYTSKTIWGAILTAAVAIVPIVVSMIQVPQPCEEHQGQLTCVEQRYNKRVEDVGQILLIVLGTALTVVGRVTATQPITTNSSNKND